LPIALVGVFFFGERLSPAGWAGIVLSTVAILMLAASARTGSARGALVPAAIAACGTTVYSLADKAAVAEIPGYAAQLGYVSLTYLGAGVLYALWLRRQCGRWWPAARPAALPLVVGALSIGTSYALVVGAMRAMPVAYAVALSNLGIALAAFVSVAILNEREHGARRLRWAAVLAASLTLVAAQL
jgi:drug/metabolite transporter (DMT)-like permease